MSKIITYVRVSTAKQSLGLDAQRSAVNAYLKASGHEEVATFQERESGRRNDRPELGKALERCRKEGAVLCIAKLDRLSRDASFLLGLQSSGVDFVACDFPQADRLVVGILALIAEREAEMISTRTKEALQAAKARGTKLGNPRIGQARKIAIRSTKAKAQAFADRIGPVLEEIRQAGVVNLKGIAQCLNRRGFKSAMGRSFTRQTVARIQRRLS